MHDLPFTFDLTADEHPQHLVVPGGFPSFLALLHEVRPTID